MASFWYVLQSKPHREAALYHHALTHGFTVYYPSIVAQRVNPRARPVIPYFPGYMFVYTDLAEVGRTVFEYMPYAVGLVSFGGEPASIDATVVETIQNRVAAYNASQQQAAADFAEGDSVLILSGPLAGCEAIFDKRLNGQDRVRVLLSFLGAQAVPTDIQIHKLGLNTGST